ncbi:OsmC family protein [Texcoconibacillus texcoconensis]|uniref:Putative OsmC-like protein n=1 Tax=Texcoconibacillus texcoconensis TaxID=1095777 RepID=A0A840QNS4_9BACI|nr:OsmC family protein [Texcoconibacillus texcoconensis]MBB5173010.1 putative OsmC-like protein [Texcoconibacillus texcoconensis]
MQKMKMAVKATNEGMKVNAKAGKHSLIIDEGSQMGGTDQGPNPMQTLLSALAACENVTAHAVAREINFDLQGLSFDVRGEFDPRGFMGDESVRTYFETVDVKVKVETSESEERIRELQELVEKRCPVYGTFKAANVTMNDEWTKA